MSASARIEHLPLVTVDELRRLGATAPRARSIVRHPEHHALATAAITAAEMDPHNRPLAEFVELLLMVRPRAITAFCRSPLFLEDLRAAARRTYERDCARKRGKEAA
jgi:hypothetical protein